MDVSRPWQCQGGAFARNRPQASMTASKQARPMSSAANTTWGKMSYLGGAPEGWLTPGSTIREGPILSMRSANNSGSSENMDLMEYR